MSTGEPRQSPERHFASRAPTYERSARWVTDSRLLARIVELAAPSPGERLLDLAIGTGRVAEAFKGLVGEIRGVDICPRMAERARPHVQEVLICPAEALPFDAGTFDICVCRQGLQFMDLDGALAEALRVLRPGGRAVLCHLTAWGEEDRERTFRIQALRNPARRNFFMPGELAARMEAQGFRRVESLEHVTAESVNDWVAHDAIDQTAREAIRRLYREAPPPFVKLHRLASKDGDIIDCMRMELVRGVKERAAP